MAYLNKHHAPQLLCLALATALLTSLFAVTSYSGTRSRSSGVAKTNGATSSLTQPQPSAELKAATSNRLEVFASVLARVGATANDCRST